MRKKESALTELKSKKIDSKKINLNSIMETETGTVSYLDEDLKLALQLEEEINNCYADDNKIVSQTKTDTVKKDLTTNKNKKKNRCNKCNKKTGMLGFDCNCGGSYCSRCRYPDGHNCEYDWKTEKIELLKKNNPKITPDKINKL